MYRFSRALRNYEKSPVTGSAIIRQTAKRNTATVKKRLLCRTCRWSNFAEVPAKNRTVASSTVVLRLRGPPLSLWSLGDYAPASASSMSRAWENSQTVFDKHAPRRGFQITLKRLRTIALSKGDADFETQWLPFRAVPHLAGIVPSQARSEITRATGTEPSWISLALQDVDVREIVHNALASRIEARCVGVASLKTSAFVRLPDFGATVYALRYAASVDWSLGDSLPTIHLSCPLVLMAPFQGNGA